MSKKAYIRRIEMHSFVGTVVGIPNDDSSIKYVIADAKDFSYIFKFDKSDTLLFKFWNTLSNTYEEIV